MNNKVFDVLEKTSKHYYTVLIGTKAKFPNNAQVLKRDFNAFQYKVLNSILLANTKLFKIGFVTEDKCSFCKSQSETLSHLLYDYIKRRSFLERL